MNSESIKSIRAARNLGLCNFLLVKTFIEKRIKSKIKYSLFSFDFCNGQKEENRFPIWKSCGQSKGVVKKEGFFLKHLS